MRINYCLQKTGAEGLFSRFGRLNKIGLLILFIFMPLLMQTASAASAEPVVIQPGNVMLKRCEKTLFMTVPVQSFSGSASPGYSLWAGATYTRYPDEQPPATMRTIPGCGIEQYYTYNIQGTPFWVIADGIVNGESTHGIPCKISFGFFQRTSVCADSFNAFTGPGYAYLARPQSDTDLFTGATVAHEIKYYIVTQQDAVDGAGSLNLYFWLGPVHAANAEPYKDITVNYTLKTLPVCSVTGDSHISFGDVAVPPGNEDVRLVAKAAATTEVDIICQGDNGPATNIGVQFTPFSPVGGQSDDDTYGLQMNNPGFFIYGHAKESSPPGNLCTVPLAGRDQDWVNYKPDTFIPMGTYPDNELISYQFKKTLEWQLCYNAAKATTTTGPMSARLQYDFTFY
jgi:hypothetical protein